MTGQNPNQFEEVLKRAFSREDAPPDFANRVLARVAEQSSKGQRATDSWWQVFTQPLVRWAAITATAASVLIGGIHYRTVQRERAQGEAAKQQLMLALRIAGSKLQLAKAKVNDINATPTKSQSRNQEE